MIKTKKIYQLVIVMIIALSYSACDSNESDASFSTTTSSSDRSITSCSDSTDVSEYTSLSSGDTIVQDTDGTQISIYHDSDGSKSVCVVSGSAYVQEG